MALIRIKDHEVNQASSYLFDTNVWIYVYGPISGADRHKQEAYSDLLRKIISRGACLYITSLVVSEYVNVVLRIGFSAWRRTSGIGLNANFKQDYRPTSDYRSQLDDAISQVRGILSVAQRRPDDFNALDMDAILDQTCNKLDYNDSYLVKCCERSNMKLVSDDKDMRVMKDNVDIITI